ncbi:MAG: superoxide dismutase [Candidatus Paceibacteria bacterium]
MYAPKSFSLGTLDGISARQLDVHLKLYEGYVTHVNKLADILKADRDDTAPLDMYVAAELRRRFAFEFDGMRMHEHYFSQWEGGAADIDGESKLAQAASAKYGSWDAFIEHVKLVSGSRGIGWTVVYADPAADGLLHTAFVGDHELGHLAGLPVILALDMWEHAFMVDYTPAEKKQYTEAFFKNLNWSVVSKRFEAA